MPDNLNLRGPADRNRVNVHEPHEVRHWTAKYGCTEQELRDAVTSVGPMAADVEAYLDRKRK